MDSGMWVPLAAAMIAAFAAIAGYVVTQLANRRDRKGKVYAEALAVMQEYRELPFRIRRRPSSDGATRAALGDKISDVLDRLGFYRSWLEIDSYVVGAAYSDLFAQVRRFGARYRNAAWRDPIISRDEEMASLAYEYDIGPEMRLCLEAMRNELSPFGFIRRKSISILLERRRQVRARERDEG